MPNARSLSRQYRFDSYGPRISPPTARQKEINQRTRAKLAQDEIGEVVYFAPIGDLIKIGYTSNLIRRMSSLKVPIGDLLAAQPGGRDLEQELHRRFEHLRAHCEQCEYFHPGAGLLDYINALRAKGNAPPITGLVRR